MRKYDTDFDRASLAYLHAIGHRVVCYSGSGYRPGRYMLNSLTLNSIIFAFLCYALLCFILNSLYFRRRAGRFSFSDSERVSILLRVSNEEANLSTCIDSLLAQTYTNKEIVILDDHSSDSSWNIIQSYALTFAPRVRALRSKPLPDGWHDKNWACHQLSKRATGEWLLFTDAGTIHEPDSVLNAYRESKARGLSLASYLPGLITQTLSEKVVLPVIYISFYLLFPLALLKRMRNHHAAFAFGSFLFVNRSTYDRIGGHVSRPDEFVNDINLARQVKKAGENFDMLDGTRMIYSRFYRNFGEIWRGFSRSALGAFGYSIVTYLAVILLAYSVFLDPVIKLAIFQDLSLHSHHLRQVLFLLGLRLTLAIKTRHSLLSVIFHPVAIGFSLLFALNSLAKVLRGFPIPWKGRALNTTKQ